jgi:uncharacterized protein (TIGR03067 family)
MKCAITLLALLGCGSLAAAADRITDPAKLAGSYTVVKGEMNGKPDLPQDIEGVVVTIKGDTISGVDKDNKKLFAYTFTLDTTGTDVPQVFAMTSTFPEKGVQASGIIELDGDILRLCYALPGGDMPTTFDTGDNQRLLVLKKMAK